LPLDAEKCLKINNMFKHFKPVYDTMPEEFLDFTKKWDKHKLNLPEVYASYRSDEENELPELDLECLQ